ncbi:hypothetical protein BH20GEM3_BH20GEM3_09380 [soil metagenome]
MHTQERTSPGTPLSPVRVSVITIFLNGERFIEEAIRSVFAQTYTDWELLLVDDGSTDASTAIARRYAAAHPQKVRYLEHPGHQNRGAAASRNLGVRNAQGEYIAFLDSDDVYLPHKLEEQVPLLDSLPEAAMLYGRARLWHTWNDNPEDMWRDELTKAAPRGKRNTLIQPPELFTCNMRDPHCYPTPSSVLARREAIDAVGGFEESFRNTFEDMTLFLKILLHFPVFVADRCWDLYRQHPDSCWAVAKKKGQYRPGRPYPAREAFLHWLETYLESRGMRGTKAWKELQKTLRPYRHPALYWPASVARDTKFRFVTWLRPRLKHWLPTPAKRLARHGLQRLATSPWASIRSGGRAG